VSCADHLFALRQLIGFPEAKQSFPASNKAAALNVYSSCVPSDHRSLRPFSFSGKTRHPRRTGLQNGAGFDPNTKTSRFRLTPGSPGAAAGQPIPNFSGGYTGKSPDLGAHQRGAAPLQYGASAKSALSENSTKE